MPRPPPTPSTVLGRAIQERRVGRTSAEVAPEIGVDFSTLLRFERGTHRPSYDTAVKLAAWLGWTTDQVMQAAAQPVPASSSQTP